MRALLLTVIGLASVGALAGLEFAAVAESLGITEATARKSYTNARKKLLAALGEGPQTSEAP